MKKTTGSIEGRPPRGVTIGNEIAHKCEIEGAFEMSIEMVVRASADSREISDRTIKIARFGWTEHGTPPFDVDLWEMLPFAACDFQQPGPFLRRKNVRIWVCDTAVTELAAVSPPCHTRGMKRLIYLLAAALLVSGVYFTIYAAVQHALRIGANDPQIQLAEDTAARLGQGRPAIDPSGDAVDVATSLAPFLIVYDPSGQVVASSAQLAGRTPPLPAGVLRDATPGHEDRLTWQPQPGVRLASVVVATPQGYVLAGRSLREVERRERDAE